MEPADELGFSNLPEQPFRPDSQVLVFRYEETELVREVAIRLVVRRGRQKDALALVFPDVFLNRLVALALAIAQIVAFVDEHHAISAQFGQIPLRRRQGKHLREQAIVVCVVFPHIHEVLRADDERFGEMIILEYLRDGRGHQRLPKADNVADQNAAALVEMVRRYLDRGSLIVEQAIAEFRRNAKFGEPGAGFLGEVVGHLDVDVIGGNGYFPRPALFDDIDKFLCDVQAPARVPSFLEPRCEFPRGVVVEDVDIEFSLVRKPCEGEVAAAQIADDRVDGVGTEQQVEFRVKGMEQKQANDELFRPELLRQTA